MEEILLAGAKYGLIPKVHVNQFTVMGGIKKAIELGATTVVCDTLPETIVEGITYIQVKDTNTALAIMAANYFDNPSQKLQIKFKYLNATSPADLQISSDTRKLALKFKSLELVKN